MKSYKVTSPTVASDRELDDSAQHIRRGQVSVAEYGKREDGTYAWFSFRKLWAFTGPGWLMSIAYLDPGNIESDLQAGAIAGYKLMWVLWWSTVIGLILQLLSARLGVVTGLNMAQLARRKYSKTSRYTLWIMMEIAVITSDIQEVIGSAIAIYILSDHKIPLFGGVLITGADTFTFLLLERYGLRKLEALFAVLVSTLAITFGYMYSEVVGPGDGAQIAEATVVPSVPDGAVEQAVGILGAVIMPHNLYLYSALVLSRDIDNKDPGQINEANKYYGVETTVALFVSFIINMFVVVVFAIGFTDITNPQQYSHCQVDAPVFNTSDPTASVCFSDNIDLFHAGCCLGQRFGSNFKYIWAVGLLAAGQSSTMTGTYAGQFIMEGFLDIKIAPWKRVLLTRTCAMVPTIAVALTASPTKLGDINEWMNVAQSFVLPFALIPLLHFTRMPTIMADYRNGSALQVFNWLVTLTVLAINIETVLATFDFATIPVWQSFVIISIMIVYLVYVLWLIVGPLLKLSYFASWYDDAPKQANVYEGDFSSQSFDSFSIQETNPLLDKSGAQHGTDPYGI
mmetsp:Transcript_23726/g.61965  ORF Transcript_23726/g.61965 Transcript_23726/m.61965 type:complete len:568 (-) Transcript_23726:91-1794(-)